VLVGFLLAPMIGITGSGPKRRAIHPRTRLRQDGRWGPTIALASLSRDSQKAMCRSSICARFAYTLASRGSVSLPAMARYSDALSTSSCQFSR